MTAHLYAVPDPHRDPDPGAIQAGEPGEQDAQRHEPDGGDHGRAEQLATRIETMAGQWTAWWDTYETRHADPATLGASEATAGTPGEQPHPRALAIPDLRPYLDPRPLAAWTVTGIKASRRPAAWLGKQLLRAPVHAAIVLRDGAIVLLRSASRWLSGEIYPKTGPVVRFIAVPAITLYGAGRAFTDYPAHTAVGLLLVVAAASRAAERPEKTDRTTKTRASTKTPPNKQPAQPSVDTHETPPADGTTQPAEDPRDTLTEPPLTALIRREIGDDNGVHLADLRPAMREYLPGLAQATDEQLRRVLVEAGFDPSRKFRARGSAGRAGVHRDQLPPLFSPTPSQGRPTPHSPPPEDHPSPAEISAPESTGEQSGEPFSSQVGSSGAWTVKHHV